MYDALSYARRFPSGAAGGLITPAKGGIQRRILFLTNGYLRFEAVTTADGIHHDTSVEFAKNRYSET